jgi:hypothetical protein
LKIGLLLDSDLVSEQTHELVLWAAQRPKVRLTRLVTQDVPGKDSNGQRAFSSLRQYGVLKLINQFVFDGLRHLEGQMLRERSAIRDHRKTYDISALVPEKFALHAELAQGGEVFRIAPDQIDTLRALKLDLVINCSGRIPNGAILNIARLGMVSVHVGDASLDRRGPAGFWEVYLKQGTSGFTIQCLSEIPNSGAVLVQGRIATRSNYSINELELCRRSQRHLLQLLEQIANTGALPAAKRSLSYIHRPYQQPNAGQSLRYLLQLVSRALERRLFQGLLGIDLRWSVAFSHCDWPDLNMARAITLLNPPNHFLADPFVYRRAGKHYCFAEDYDYATERGLIAVYELNASTGTRLGEALVEPFHLSFPYLFEYQGELYMCPESSAHKQIRLYRCIEFPLKWQLEKVLMSNLSAADTLLFEYQGLWWLFTNIDPFDRADHGSELSIFYADSPLTDQWTPHPKNPVIIDASRARNAGFLRRDGELYRPAQKLGFNAYGTGFVINRIIKLSTTEYEEETIVEVKAKFRAGLHGTHHIHSSDGVTVFDALERSWIKR